MRRPPLGQQVHATLVALGPQAAVAVAQQIGQPDLFDRVNAVACEEPSPSFLHSALCAMSLPVRRPQDDSASIIRQDGQYTLVITPKAVIRSEGGQSRLHVIGVPYGSLPRLILIHVMTEAVRRKSRQIRLGSNFTDWMRRMGYKTMSYGPRGSATLIKQQLDRLLACEWMIRWDGEGENGEKEFGIREIKLTNEYVGVDTAAGSFMREIVLTEGFFEHLRRHAVPLNEHAIRQLRESPTALDLYTWLAYRLPRIGNKRPVSLSWQQLAVHFGNDGHNIRKFRQTVRDAWERQVSAVYPEARAEFDSTVIRLHSSPAPLQQTAIRGAHLAPVVTDAQGTQQAGDDVSARFLEALQRRLGPEARAWLTGARLIKDEDGWVLQVPTAFKADWIRSRFQLALEHAGSVVSLPGRVSVRAAAKP
jgi:hypothetical protein